MIDIVIPLGSGSKHKNIELRYCLRSIERFVYNYQNIYVVGECPGWLQNIIHLPFKEYEVGAKYKEENICRKIIHASKVCSYRFLLVHDDHFLLYPYNAELFPPYYKGTVVEEMQKRTEDDPYFKTLQNTAEHIDYRMKYFDIHCPMVVSKYGLDMFNSIYPMEYGVLFKSSYARHSRIGGYERDDLKFREPLEKFEIYEKLKSRSWFSLDERALNSDMLEVLESFYPSKSSYEM